VRSLESAKHEAERLFREYHDLDRGYIESEMLKLQQSQRLATWASFAVAAAVGIATIVQYRGRAAQVATLPPSWKG
jgi:hypothetical protein